MNDTPLVMLPGMDGTGELFEPLIECLPPSIRPIVVAYPGDRNLTYHELVEFVGPICPTEQPFAILAESFSGPIAVRLAAQRPPGLNAVILAATFVRSPLPWLPGAGRHLVGSWMFQFPMPAAAIRLLLGNRQTTPEIVRAVQSATRRVSPAVLALRVREVLNVDVTDALLHVTVPLLSLAGRRDRLVTSRSGELIRQLRPDIECAIVEAPHLLLQTQPQECAKIITEFLSRRTDCSTVRNGTC